MHNSYTGAVRLDACRVTIDAGHHLVVQPQDGGRLPGSYSEQLNFPPYHCIRENASLLAGIDSLPEESVLAAHHDACEEFSADDLPQASGGDDLVACQ